MVTTRFKEYSSGISFSKISSTSCSSDAMDPTAPKSTTSSKGKQYKGIPTKHLIRRYANPFHRVSTVRFPVLHIAPMQSDRQILCLPKLPSRPEPRVSVETVVLDSESSDSDDNVILSTLLHRTRSARSNQTTSSEKPQASGGVSPQVAPPQPSEHTKYFGTQSSQKASSKTAPPSEVEDEDDDSDDEDYAPRTEEKTEAETTSTSTENQSASLEKDPSDHRSTEEPGESSIPRSTEGPSEFLTLVSTPAHVASSSGFRRPLTKGQRVVSTKAVRRKAPPNVSSVPIDGVSFHSEEGAHKWKYVVKQRIANEANIADRYNFCSAILELIRNVDLIRTLSEVGPFYPRLMRELIVNLPSDFNDPSADEYQKVHIRGVCFNVSSELLNSYLGITLLADYAVSYPTLERLPEDLTSGTVPVWPVDGQLPVAFLTIKYSILYRIGISNWIPSTHASTILTLLGHFVYLVGTGVKVNQSTILTPLDTVGSVPQVIPLTLRLFQGAHFPDVAVEFDNAPGGTSTPAASQPAVGHPVTLSVSLANRLLQALIVESRALTRQISELTDHRTVLDAVIGDLRSTASGTIPPPSD
ncbi:flocculation protein FLO11-like [Cucumis melo var. makuwa]|uniref:Flocculation protein FLO11-like n=1 Tax=Cucumis melo var. makuwa TaxID=1194695 RepID=A0A5D3BAW7_CUCMM|nr:flocculation protein FLO11-like [Cucumis melo var. makuwa]